METLLALVASWVSLTVDLPPPTRPPNVEFVTAERMLEVRSGRLSESEVAAMRAATDGEGAGDLIHALYDDASETIYLPTNWRRSSQRDLSVLVHEMAHHMQNVGGVAYDCGGARERPAYRAQARWLKDAGLTLESAFGLDPMTVFVRTNCWS